MTAFGPQSGVYSIAEHRVGIRRWSMGSERYLLSCSIATVNVDKTGQYYAMWHVKVKVSVTVLWWLEGMPSFDRSIDRSRADLRIRSMCNYTRHQIVVGNADAIVQAFDTNLLQSNASCLAECSISQGLTWMQTAVGPAELEARNYIGRIIIQFVCLFVCITFNGTSVHQGF